MDEMLLNGKNHVSSKRAAEITGYAKDYIGQLCREGRIEARLVGRSWYVDEESLRQHRFGTEASVSEEQVTEEATEEVLVEEPAYANPEEIETVPDEAPIEHTPELSQEEAIERIEEGDAPVAPDPSDEAENIWKPATYTSEEFTVLPEIKNIEKPTEVVSSEREDKEEAEEVHLVRNTTVARSHVKTMYDIKPTRESSNKVEINPGKRKKIHFKAIKVQVPQVLQTRSVISALFIALALFSVAFSSIVTGIYTQETGPLARIFEYLGGTSRINK